VGAVSGFSGIAGSVVFLLDFLVFELDDFGVLSAADSVSVAFSVAVASDFSDFFVLLLFFWLAVLFGVVALSASGLDVMELFDLVGAGDLVVGAAGDIVDEGAGFTVALVAGVMVAAGVIVAATLAAGVALALVEAALFVVVAPVVVVPVVPVVVVPVVPVVVTPALKLGVTP